MLTLLRSEKGYCSRCHLVGDTFAVEEHDRSQRLLCVPCIQEIEPGREVPEPFGRMVLPSPRDGWRPPPVAHTPAEAWETALIVGYPGGLGSTITREE